MSESPRLNIADIDPSALERVASMAEKLGTSSNEASRLIASEIQQQNQFRQNMNRRVQTSNAVSDRLSHLKNQILSEEYNLKENMTQEKVKLESELSKRRQAEWIQGNRNLKDEEIAMTEQSTRKQEELVRQTALYEAQLNQEVQMARIAAETEGKILNERENHRLHMESAKLKASEKRQTILEAISLTTSSLGSGAMELLGDRDRLLAFAGTAALVAFGIYSAKVTTGVAGRVIESRIGKPSLVRETSRRTPLQLLRSPRELWKSIERTRGLRDPEMAMKDVVLVPALDLRLRNLARSTLNTRKNNAPFRHVLLHGHPGTGKTMFAKQLARAASMDYAIMTGGDINPLGKDSVSEIHKLFDWAENSQRGVLLFIDEAEAFLQKREKARRLTPEMRNALNAFLYRTGEASSRFLLVFSTNQPGQIDSAIMDRIDEVIPFSLPGLTERKRMLQQYFTKYVVQLRTRDGKEIRTSDDVTLDFFDELAQKTEGFSGREISKLGIAWQSLALGAEDLTITKQDMLGALARQQDSHARKSAWMKKNISTNSNTIKL